MCKYLMDSFTTTLPSNPKDEANFLSVLFFWWTVDLFKIGYSKALEVKDLFKPLYVDKSSNLGDRLERNWLKEATKEKPVLVKAVLRTFWREISILALLVAFNELFIRLCQPVLLGKLLEHFRLGDDGQSQGSEIFYYGSGIIFLSALNLISFNHFTMNAFHLGMKVRVAMCSVIYRKSLRLSRTAIGDTSPGKIVNLLSNDVSRFDIVTIFLNSMWSAPLLSIIVAILLWQEIQWAGIVGILVVFIVVPIQSYTGNSSAIFRLQTAIRTDERIRFMDEIISGVQVIKMYAWERPFTQLITLARKLELKIVRRNSHVRVLYMTFNLFTTRAAMFCCLLTMVLTCGEITAPKVFVISSYFNVISWTMSQMFARGVAEVAEARVSLTRLQKFLEYEEQVKEEDAPITVIIESNEALPAKKANMEKLQGSEKTIDVSIAMENVTTTWQLPKKKDEDHGNVTRFNLEDPTLKNINLEIRRGYLIGVCGSVGSGKSSLLQVILKELPILKGKMQINGLLSYASQEPWVFAATIRQNILFGQEMNKRRYEMVVKCCALPKDFDQFPDGDSSVIGEKGASLSGGQKARISLARAVYRKADIYLLDDPLSAVDAHVGKHLFDEVIGQHGRLAGKTRILVTHQIHFLSEADWVVILEDGEIKAQGPPQELSESGIDFAELLQSEEQNENKDEKISEKISDLRSITRSLSRASSRSKGSSYHSIRSISGKDKENKNVMKIENENPNFEASSKGIVKGSLLLKYLRSGANICIVVIVGLLFVLTQFAVSAADYWVSFWTSQEELRNFYSKNSTPTAFNENSFSFIENLNVFHAINSQYQKNEQSDHLGYNSLLSTDICIYVHGALIVSIFVIGIIRAEVFYELCLRSSQKLHDEMFRGIISAAMRFFDTNPSGRILNRFSKDMGQMDELLPKALLDAGQIMLTIFGSIIVTATVKPIFFVPVLILGVLFMLIGKIYLQSSKNIKRLEGITRSPVFTHLSATLGGLSTIRSFGAENELIKEFDGHQDIHTSAWYMFISTSTAFGLSLNIICVVFMACVTFYFLLIEKGSSGSEVGLAITQSMALAGLLQWGIRYSAEVVNHLMSVERILEYCQLENENKSTQVASSKKEWPSQGKIEFKNFVYRYSDGGESVLKGLNFVINPQEKVGIVGRTGAGKSSLIGALFRLAKIEGEILIDDINTRNIALSELRSQISIIPQDPVLFSGTLRRNLDPFEEYSNSDLWHALKAVELKDTATENLGLQSRVMANGSNFSVGQRQLICLARAILRNNKILVLDEATANVDPHTDALIQTTIREQFSNCTVLTIAHRLHTIMDSDKVLVMNFGKVAEFDLGYNLLQNNNGIFKNMVDATGHQESERLFELAKTKFESIQKIL